MLVLLLLAAAPYESCDTAADCAPPEECVVDIVGENTVCRAPCSADADCDDAGGTAVCGADDYCHLFCDERVGGACPQGFVCEGEAGACIFVDIDPDEPTACECDDDCPIGTACAELGPDQFCVAACSADDSTCPVDGAVCTLGVDVGLCLPGVVGELDGGNVCTNANECRSSNCSFDPRLGRSVCVEECASDDDCVDGAACVENLCLARSVACAEEPPPLPPDDAEPPSCSAHAVDGGAPSAGALAICAALAIFGRSRKND